MPADPVSRYLEDSGANMGEAKANAHEIYLNLKTSHNVLVDYGRINGDISPEQRQAKKEEDRRAWLESGRHTTHTNIGFGPSHTIFSVEWVRQAFLALNFLRMVCVSLRLVSQPLIPWGLTKGTVT